MRVVKLGGSLADWDRLPQCLASLISLGVAIVPGGGSFANQVRAMQRRWRFDDRTAHAMAILAMAQFGRMLTGLEGRLRVASSTKELQTCVTQGLTTIWLPRPEELDREGIPPSWEVTSDSLAAWLATRLGATDLILLKSAVLQPGQDTLPKLIADGTIDSAFARFTAASCAIWVCHREDYPALASIVDHHADSRLMLARR